MIAASVSNFSWQALWRQRYSCMDRPGIFLSEHLQSTDLWSRRLPLSRNAFHFQWIFQRGKHVLLTFLKLAI